MAYDQNVRVLKSGILTDYHDCRSNFGNCLGIGLYWPYSGRNLYTGRHYRVCSKAVCGFGMALFATYTLSTMTDYFMFIFEEIAMKGV